MTQEEKYLKTATAHLIAAADAYALATSGGQEGALEAGSMLRLAAKARYHARRQCEVLAALARAAQASESA